MAAASLFAVLRCPGGHLRQFIDHRHQYLWIFGREIAVGEIKGIAVGHVLRGSDHARLLTTFGQSKVGVPDHQASTLSREKAATASDGVR